MRSPVLQRIINDMNNQPWHVKLRRSIRVQLWVWSCLTRRYWDRSFWKK